MPEEQGIPTNKRPQEKGKRSKSPIKGARKEQSARKEGVPDGKTPRKGQQQGESDPRQGIVPEIQLSHIGTFEKVKLLRIGVYVNMEATENREAYMHCPVVTEFAVAAMRGYAKEAYKGERVA